MATLQEIKSVIYEDCPYTKFPEAIDTITRKRDVDLETKTALDQYYTYVNAGNFTAAATLLSENAALKQTVMTAEDYNKMRDGLIAVQRVFDAYVADYILSVVKPKGYWSPTETYEKFNVVTYNHNNATRTYMCLPADETLIEIPINIVPTNTDYWACITMVGQKGESGTGLSPAGAYDPEYTYYPNDLVVYDGQLWLANEEVFGEVPNEDSGNWSVLALIPVADDEEEASSAMAYSGAKTEALITEAKNDLQSQINRMNNITALTLTVNGWTPEGTGVYVQTIEFTGYDDAVITADDRPEIFYDDMDSTEEQTQTNMELYAEECGFISKIETIAGGLKATAHNLPTMNINLLVKGV